MSFIEIKNITRLYQSGETKIKALDHISFDIEEGKFTVILGPSGSGKSTVLNLLGGMDRPTEGSIMVNGRDITKLNDKELTEYRRHEIGFVFQFYNLIPTLTAFENVEMVSNLNKNAMNALDALEAVDLLDRKSNFPSQMSGGELQRVSIARALCKNSKLLLCDEPTGALDSQTGKKILSLLQGMSKKYNKAVIVVTHNAAIAPSADRVIRLKDGNLEELKDNKKPKLMEEVTW